MLEKLKARWLELKEGEPGRRFREAHRRHRGSGRERILFLLAGGVVFAAGIFFLPAPGPGVVILVLGGGLLAQGSETVARALDWSELRIRRLGAWGLGVWAGASPAGRAGLAILGAALAGAAAYATYRLFFS